MPQINPIPVASKTFVRDDQAVDDDLKALCMPLVGAFAWLILTMPAMCVYFAYFQRHAKEPTVGHIRLANRLLSWVRENLKRLGI